MADIRVDVMIKKRHAHLLGSDKKILLAVTNLAGEFQYQTTYIE